MKKKVRVYYFNDRRIPALVSIGTLAGKFDRLPPATGGMYELELEENQVPYIKVWETNHVLISGMDYDGDSETQRAA